MNTILVVDDDPGITRLIRLVLEAKSYTVLSTNRPEDGLELLSKEQPSLVVLDLVMPGMDGRTFYRMARATGYNQPVLIISATDAHGARRELGADASLEKPFDPEVLAQQVEDLLPIAS